MATFDETQLPCPTCGGPVLARRRGCNHLVHALVTLFLCGLWAPVWLIAATSLGPYRCTKCGENLESHKPTSGQSLTATLSLVVVVVVIGAVMFGAISLAERFQK